MAEGEETCGKVDRVLGCSDASRHDVMGSAFLLNHVRDSLKRKPGDPVIPGDAGPANAVAAAVPADVVHDENTLCSIQEYDARCFEGRDVAWILARKNSLEPNKRPRPFNISSVVQVEVLSSSTDLQNHFVEGARNGATLGQAEKNRTPEKRNFDMAGSSTEVATTTTTAGCGQSNPEGATHGTTMDPLTPEIVQQTCGGRSPGSSTDYTSSPELTDHAGGLLSNDREAPCRTPGVANGAAAAAMSAKTTSTPPPRGAQPREYVTKLQVQANLSVTDKSTRKRKYQPKIRVENPKQRTRANRTKVGNVNASPAAEIPKTTRSPTLLHMKSLARINQRRPTLKRQQQGKAAATAISMDFPAHDTPDCSVSPRLGNDPALQDAIIQSTDFLRFLRESLFADLAVKLSPADRADINLKGSLFTCSSHLVEEVVDKDRATAPEGPPSTPRGQNGPFLSTCQGFTLVTSPWSPPSPYGDHVVADLWNNFDEDTTTTSHNVSAKSVRRALNFDAPELQEDHANLCKEPPQLAAAHNINLLQVSAEVEFSEPQVVALDPGFSGREKELQMVAYDEGSKRMVVYRRRVSRVRRVRYKPKVNLDTRTLKMFRTLTITAAAGAGEDEAEDDKASWERSRQLWQHRAHHFISIMRKVQGNRSFSRWKGSVVDSVGGAFLTQNVSDFLSSNAFIALRARFPARPRDSNAPEKTPHAQAQVEKECSIPMEASLPQPERSIPVDEALKKGDLHRQEEEASSTRVSHELLQSNTDTSASSVEQSLPELIEILRRGFIEHCRIGEKFPGADSRSRQNAQAPEICTTSPSMTERTPHNATASKVPAQLMKESNPTLSIDSPEFEAWTEHRPDKQIVSRSAKQFLHTENSSWDQDVLLQPECACTISVSNAEHNAEINPERESAWMAWKGALAQSGVIQKKFSSVVTESVSSLTAVGKEKVLAATLRLVLGKEKTTRELQLGQLQKALNVLKLRPGRAGVRSSTDNYRYRRSVSYKLLSGEARANWEAGFVMKSQKAKWEPLRAAIIVADENGCRDPWTEDCVDWAAVHKASVHEVAEVIKNRGMNHSLAGRIKAFLDRVHREQNGSIDLEWIRKLPPEDAKEFLLSFRGVGIKSVECIRLLTLHHPSFPVDTNVGRILVRLGWVPLEPLPEETQLHLLELYPIQSQIQQYAWPRLCTLDEKTLYELHYQMITFGKVFCTKSKPNCNACPMRTECKHYASSYASAKLLLKGPEKQEKQSAAVQLALQGADASTESTQYSTLSSSSSTTKQPCIPIIEEPRSPEPSSAGDMSIPDIEEIIPWDFDAQAGVPVEVVSIGPSCSEEEAASLVAGELCTTLEGIQTMLLDLNREPEPETSCALQLPSVGIAEMMEVVAATTVAIVARNTEPQAAHENIAQAPDQEDEEEVLPGGMVPDDFKHVPSQELILLPPLASSTPAPQLKNIQRLRTVHFVYELPDNHPLLFGMDKREADDPCFYLLAIWSPDEVPATLPKINDDECSNPFASCDEGCNVGSEQTSTVRGTILIPCKTAMRGWFPLNGTYFQVNEVFADHASSVQPIDVPRTLLWSLRRRFVYFSTAVSNLFRDMSQDEIQCCFQKGYVCLRAFDVATRQPRNLAPRLHQSGAKIVIAPAPRKGRGRPQKNPLKDNLPTKSTKIGSSSEGKTPGEPLNLNTASSSCRASSTETTM